MSKGSKRRPALISREEEDLRWAVFEGRLKISVVELNRRVKKIRSRKGLRG